MSLGAGTGPAGAYAVGVSRPTAQVRSTEVVGGWTVEHRRGTASELHSVHDIVGDRRLVQVNEVSHPALVLGSAQSDGVVDRDLLEARGIDLARRRSGGGAVLLVPGEHVWIDVVLPATDPLWSDDVAGSAWWLGERWAAAVHPEAVVHRDGMRRRELARLVCFAGVGPGEVSVGGRKLVGISQRRTRSWARFQCVVHRRWNPTDTLALLAVRPDGLERAMSHRVTALDAWGDARWDAVGGLLEQLV